VLVVTLRGTNEDQWDRLNGRDFWLTAGGSRYDLIQMTGWIDSEGKIRPDYRLVFRVPKAKTSFVLHYEKASVPFSATGPIKPNIDQ
jgi:hypothetical protein